MDQREARDQMSTQRAIDVQAWSAKAINRATEKIRVCTGWGKKECELDLKYPPRNPDDATSSEVAELLLSHFGAKGYSVQMVDRTDHLGAICRIKWSGSKRLDAQT
jgi:hypothetical protein